MSSIALGRLAAWPLSHVFETRSARPDAVFLGRRKVYVKGGRGVREGGKLQGAGILPSLLPSICACWVEQEGTTLTATFLGMGSDIW